MNKKLTKHGNSLALVIDKPILQLLKINEKTVLEVSIENNSLIIRPVSKKSKNSKHKAIDEIAERIMDKYSDAFKKLSKT